VKELLLKDRPSLETPLKLMLVAEKSYMICDSKKMPKSKKEAEKERWAEILSSKLPLWQTYVDHGPLEAPDVLKEAKALWDDGKHQYARLLLEGYASVENKRARALDMETVFLQDVFENHESSNWKKRIEFSASEVAQKNDDRVKSLGWTEKDPKARAQDFFADPTKFCTEDTTYYITATHSQELIDEFPTMFKLENPIHSQVKFTPGVNSCYIYTSQAGCTFLCHLEDYRFLSINWHLHGDPAVWILINPEDRHDFLLEASEHLQCPVSEILRKTYLFTPELLDVMGIGYKLYLQQPGEMIIVDFMTIHLGFKTGFSQCISMNITDDFWVECFEDGVLESEMKEAGSTELFNWKDINLENEVSTVVDAMETMLKEIVVVADD